MIKLETSDGQTIYFSPDSVGTIWDYLPRSSKNYSKQAVLRWKQGGHAYLEGYDADEIKKMIDDYNNKQEKA